MPIGNRVQRRREFREREFRGRHCSRPAHANSDTNAHPGAYPDTNPHPHPDTNAYPAPFYRNSDS